MSAPTDLTMHSLWDDILKVLKRRKRFVLLVAALITVVVYVGLSFKGDRYEAKADLLVKVGRAYGDVPLTVEKGTVFSDGVNKEEINTYISLLRSRPLLKATVDRVSVERFFRQPPPPESFLKRIKYHAKQVARWGKSQLKFVLIKIGLKPDLEDRELAVILLEKSLAVEHEKDTNVINLSLRLGDPILAQEVLEVLIELYMEKHIAVVQTESTEEAFKSQVLTDRTRLEALRAEQLELRKRLDIGDLDEKQIQLARQIGALEDTLRDTARQKESLRASLIDITSQLDTLEEQVLASVTIEPSPALQKMKNRLSELRIERAGATAKFQAGSNQLLMLDEEIADIQTRILLEQRTEEGDRVMARNPLLDVLQTRLSNVAVDLKSLQAGEKTATTQRAALSEELSRLNQAEADLATLELETKVAENRFLASSARLEEARSQTMLNANRIANISVFSPPAFSWKPVAPRRLLIMVGAVVGGFAIGFGLALFLEWQSEVLHEASDFKDLPDVPFLGSIRTE